MEFPSLGKHCSVSHCNKLDFLPVKCDACGKILCHEHMLYKDHQCPEANARNYQVPICPLCNQPVPSKRGEPPDIAVGVHIDSDCQFQRKHEIFSNRCSMKNCHQKEIVRVVCKECKFNFCLKHRHTTDHNCQGRPLRPNENNIGVQRNIQLAKAFDISSIQGTLSEDEAVARAMALSLQDSHEQTSCDTNHNCVIS